MYLFIKSKTTHNLSTVHRYGDLENEEKTKWGQNNWQTNQDYIAPLPPLEMYTLKTDYWSTTSAHNLKKI